MKVAYEIFHYRIGEPIRFLYSSIPCLLIVWKEDRVLGDRWITEGITNEHSFLKNIDFIESRYKDHQEKDIISSRTQVSLSVVICTRNRTAMLARCLYQLQQSSDTDFEIIVVDNAPDTDDTKQLVAKFPHIIYTRENRKGLDIARNTGATLASGTIVAYTDDDVIVDSNWIHTIKQSFTDASVMAVTGLILPVSITTKAQYIFEKFWSFNKGYQPIIFDQAFISENDFYAAPVWEIGAGANMAFRKDAFLLNGYFDERLDVGAAGCSGDSEYWYSLLANGWKCFYNPHAIVFHVHRDSMKGLRKQLYHYMRGQVASLFVQFEQYGHKGNLRRIYRALPLYYLKRMGQLLRGKNWLFNQTLITEIAGAMAGIFFYHQHKQKQNSAFSLLAPVVITESSVVSIVITNYNYAHYLGQAIQSCIDQTYPFIEIIVVDDGSTDNSLSVINTFQQVKLIQTNRVKLSEARNVGAKAATGDFIVFLDADDYLLTDAIEKQIYFLKYYPEAVFIIGNHLRIDDKNEPLQVRPPKELVGYAFRFLLEGNFIGMEAAVMYRKEIFDYFSFDINLHACEDYDLNLRIARYFPCVAHKDEVAVYRIHNGSMSANQDRMWQTVQTVLEKNRRQILSDEESNAIVAGFLNWKKIYEHP